MSQSNLNRFFDALRQDSGLKDQVKSATNSETVVDMARNHGFDFTLEEFQEGVNRLSREEMAAMINPGIAPRRHLNPR